MNHPSAFLLSLLTLLLTWSESALAQSQSNGLVMESHVGARPRDADSLLAPLLDELERNGYAGGSVTGTRVHSKHSISSEQLTQKQIETAKRDVKDAHAAFIDFQFKGAVQTGSRALALLMSRPATMARQQQVREYLYDALIIMSMANSRLGNDKGLTETMGEFIRSFPDRDVSVKKYGPEGAELYREINKRMSAQQKGHLQIAASAGSMVFVNERYVGIGSLKLDLYPGQYRIYTQNGARKGRVHVAQVEAEQKQTLVVDLVVDKSLKSTNGFVGLVFDDEEERNLEERRVTLLLGTAIGVEEIILVGIHKFKGRDSVVASALSISSGESGLSARVPLPATGAPSADQLRALAAFVSGSKPASPDIQVFTVKEPIPTTSSAGATGDSLVLETDAIESAEHNAGISSAWRWSSWGLGVAALGVGGYLISIDGEGSCTLQPGQMICPESFDTIVPGASLLGAGAALGVLGFYLWSKESAPGDQQLSVMPTSGGLSVTFASGF